MKKGMTREKRRSAHGHHSFCPIATPANDVGLVLYRKCPPTFFHTLCHSNSYKESITLCCWALEDTQSLYCSIVQSLAALVLSVKGLFILFCAITVMPV